MSRADFLDRVAMPAGDAEVEAVGRPVRLTLFTQILAACVHDTRELHVMGLRLLVLGTRLVPGCLGRVKSAMAREMRAAEATAYAMMQISTEGVEMDQRLQLLELLTGDANVRRVDARALGRRVTLLAYAFCREPEVRAALPSFEHIGRCVWMLSAGNPRSAVSAGMKKLLGGLVQRRFMTKAEHDEMLRGWFGKRPETKRKYAVAQVGNGNRVSGKADAETEEGEDDAPACRKEELRREHLERLDGVPRGAMRPEFQGRSAAWIRSYLQRLHEEHELRRLGVG